MRKGIMANWLTAAFRYRVQYVKHLSDICSIECHVQADLHHRLNSANEITLSIKGRKSGRDIPRSIWFVYEGNTLYLLPNHGSDTNWYKNVLVDPTLKVSANGIKIPAKGKLTDSNRVNDIVRKFNSKYGEVKKYYTKFDVAVEVTL